MLRSPVTYWQLASHAEAMQIDPSVLKQIDSDLPRTFPQHMGFASDSGLRRALRRVLVTYAAYNASVGYCQSLNFIAACFLLVGDEEGAFWLLAALCKTVVPDYHTQAMAGLRIDTNLFASLVEVTLPQLHQRLVGELEVPIEILASQWWLCMYANVLPTATLLRTWDVVLSGGGVETLLASALAILKRWEKPLMAAEDIAGVYAVLADATPAMWDPDDLMILIGQTMSSLDSHGTRLAALQIERQNKRQAQLEETVKGTRFSADTLGALMHHVMRYGGGGGGGAQRRVMQKLGLWPAVDGAVADAADAADAAAPALRNSFSGACLASATCASTSTSPRATSLSSSWAQRARPPRTHGLASGATPRARRPRATAPPPSASTRGRSSLNSSGAGRHPRTIRACSPSASCSMHSTSLQKSS